MTTDIEVMEDFSTLNDRVKEGLATFVEVGRALAQIKERKLYKEAGHATFAAYTQAEHGFSRDTGYRMIRAASVEDLAPGISQQAAEVLARVPEDDRAAVVSRATTRQGSKPTAEMIADMHQEIIEERQPAARAGTIPDEVKQRFREAYASVQRSRAMVTSLGCEREGRLLDVDACVVHLNNTLEEIKFAVPKHRCPYCGGTGCQQCKHSGMLSDRLWNLADDEVKSGAE
jgi:hypothetical protein